ncbi:MAG: AAA family ATPase [Desulfobacterales bacterium]|jgi:chromosome partitioning protein
MAKRRTRIIAVANEKGGVGKTVTVINLGAALQQAGKTVLIVDMDPQFNATRGLGVESAPGAPSVYDLISKDGAVSVDEVLVNTGWEGLDLIPSHVDLSGAEVELVEVTGRENRLKEALEQMDGRYDFILCDTPPSLSLLTINVFAYAREVLVPCQTHPYAFAALEELFDTIDAVGSEINDRLTMTGILATLYDQRTRVGNRILEKLRSDERYGPLLLKTVIRTNTTIADSADVGKPVLFYRRASYGAEDYTALAREILSRPAG